MNKIMKIYIAHSRNIDFINELYKPIKNSVELSKYELILPHERKQENNNNRIFYKNLDMIIADVSRPSTGLGIELGWAYDDNVKIYCIYKKGFKYSSSLKAVSDNFYEYSNELELIDIIKKIISEHK